MKRIAVLMLLFAASVASAASASAQVYTGPYGAYYRPYPPRAAYWNGYYSRPGLTPDPIQPTIRIRPAIRGGTLGLTDITQPRLHTTQPRPPTTAILGVLVAASAYGLPNGRLRSGHVAGGRHSSRMFTILDGSWPTLSASPFVKGCWASDAIGMPFVEK